MINLISSPDIKTGLLSIVPLILWFACVYMSFVRFVLKKNIPYKERTPRVLVTMSVLITILYIYCIVSGNIYPLVAFNLLTFGVLVNNIGHNQNNAIWAFLVLSIVLAALFL